MDDRNKAVVLKVGNRFFRAFKNRRIQTAWSLAGAKLFGNWDELNISKTEKLLKEKGYISTRILIEACD